MTNEDKNYVVVAIRTRPDISIESIVYGPYDIKTANRARRKLEQTFTWVFARKVREMRV